MKPIVTIVTPLTGGPESRKNLRSWVSRIHDLPISLILIHDVSDPETGREVSEIAALLPRDQVTVIQGFYGSPGGARNAGLDLATSDWVVFWDSDDVGEPENLVHIVQENYESSVVICAYTKNKDFEGRSSNPITLDNRRNLYLQMANQAGLWRYVFKREFINDLRFSHNMMGEDQLFLIELNLFDVEVRYSPKVVYHYYFGSDGHLTSNPKIQSQVKNTMDLMRSNLEATNRHFNLFESAVYFKIFLSVCKYSSPLMKISAILHFLSLILIKRKINLRDLGKIVSNLLFEYKENNRAHR